MDFQKAWNRKRLKTYLIAILSVFGCAYLLQAFLLLHENRWYLFLIAAALIAVAVLTVLLSRKKEQNTELSGITEERWYRLFDRYARRSINWILIAFSFYCGAALSLIVLGVNSKADEVAESIIGQMLLWEAIAFFLVKNLMLLHWLNKRHPFEKIVLFRKELRRVLIVSAIYWLLGGALFFAFERIFVLDISPFLSAVYALGIVAYNFFRIHTFTYSQKKYRRIVIAVALSIAVLVGGYAFLSRDVWLTQPYINSVPYIYEGKAEIAYNDETGVYTITKPEGEFKILQLTDIHLGGSALSYGKDLKALKAVFALLEETKPDLVVVTGDMAFPVGFASFSFNNTAPVQQFAAFMRNTGVPWAFTYGNHDTESYAATSEHGLNELYMSLSWKTSRTLLYPYTQPEITGRSNQLIEIREQDGSLYEALFLIDSNAYTGKGLNKYDYIHDDQVEWYRSETERLNAEAGKTVPSLIFFHIPLQQYKTAYELYEQGSDAVTYYSGSNDETMLGKVCCSEYPSTIFDTAKSLGSTQGFFCGHDHYNNMSLEYEGIRLTYGMSIDYLAMPGIARDVKQRGATLILLDSNGDMYIEQVPLATVMKQE